MRQRRVKQSVTMIWATRSAVAFALLLAACSGTTKVGDEPESGPGGDAKDGTAAADKPVSNVPLGPVTKGSQREHPAGKAWVVGDGEPRAIDIGEAEAKGMTVLDLGDGWTPYIFTEKTAGTEE
jgi:hypothetical protein